jgi:hypothetical protein
MVLRSRSRPVVAIVFLTMVAVLSCCVTIASATPAHELVGHVTSSQEFNILHEPVTGVAGTVVEIIDPSTEEVMRTAETNSTGLYRATVPSGIYDVLFMPPSGSGYSSRRVSSILLGANSTLSVVLTNSAPVYHWSGVVRGLGGAPIDGMEILFEGDGVQATSETDASGAFSLPVAADEDTLKLNFSQNNQNVAPMILRLSGLRPVTGDIEEDLQLPVHKLTITYEGPHEELFSGIQSIFSVDHVTGSIGGVTVTSAQAGMSATSDASGNAVLVVPTFSGIVTAENPPPPGSIGLGSAEYVIEGSYGEQHLTVVFPLALTIHQAPDGLNGWFVHVPAEIDAGIAGTEFGSLSCGLDGRHVKATPEVIPSGSVEPVTIKKAGRHSVECTANDHAGHTETAKAAVLVDFKPPQAPVAHADRPPDYAGHGGWYRNSVTVSFTAQRDPGLPGGVPGSGINPSSLTGAHTIAASGTHSAVGTVADIAGNVSKNTTLTVKVDADPPTTTLTCPATLALGSAAHATWHDSDGQSGLDGPATGRVVLNTATRGTFSLTHTATDNVGHSATSSCDYAVV